MNINSHCSDLLIVCLINFLTLVTHVKCDLYPTLTFYQDSHAIINIPGKIRKGDTEIQHPIALACPAQTSEEIKFNEKSFSNNSLFVKEVYEAKENLENIEYKRCEKRYQLSICHQKSPAEFLFGYEIYVEQRSYPQIETKNYDKFDYVANAFSWVPLTKKSKPKLELANDRPLKFIWILSFRMIFDDNRSRPKQVIYTISKATETGVECKDYDLGKEIYEIKKINLDWAYENQQSIYKGVKMPNSINALQKPACETEYRCLTKGSLIPPEEFRFRYPEPKSISCSDATTVPIWKSIVQETLQKLDKFLYALSKIVHGDLRVTAGVHGKLQMPNDSVNQSKKTIRLGMNGEITVPHAIYKIVKLDVLIPNAHCNCDELIQVTKAVVIVIINDPYFDPTGVFCNIKNCGRWGWGQILYEHVPSTGSASPYVFCCDGSEETLKKTSMKLDERRLKLLNLTHFPVHDAKSDKVTYEDIEQEVVEKMVKLFGGNKDSNDDHEGEGIQDDENFYSSENEENKNETTLEAGEILSNSFGSINSDDIPVPRSASER